MMETVLIILGAVFVVENIVLLIVFFIRRPYRQKVIDRNKSMRTEFNSAMVNLRKLEHLLKAAAREDGK